MPRMDKLSNYRTTVSQIGGDTVVIYVSTPVVAFNRDRIVLRSGGHETVTTKRKMNQAARQFGLGYVVYQRDWRWYVRHTTTDFNQAEEWAVC